MLQPYRVTYSIFDSDKVRSVIILGHSKCHAVNLLYQYYSAMDYDLNEMDFHHFSCDSMRFISPKVVSDIKQCNL